MDAAIATFSVVVSRRASIQTNCPLQKRRVSINTTGSYFHSACISYSEYPGTNEQISATAQWILGAQQSMQHAASRIRVSQSLGPDSRSQAFSACTHLVKVWPARLATYTLSPSWCIVYLRHCVWDEDEVSDGCLGGGEWPYHHQPQQQEGDLAYHRRHCVYRAL